MGDRIDSVIKAIPAWGKATAWLITAAGVGAVISGWIPIPSDVRILKEVVATHVVDIRELRAEDVRMKANMDAGLERIYCLLTLPDSISPLQSQVLCQ